MLMSLFHLAAASSPSASLFSSCPCAVVSFLVLLTWCTLASFLGHCHAVLFLVHCRILCHCLPLLMTSFSSHFLIVATIFFFASFVLYLLAFSVLALFRGFVF